MSDKLECCLEDKAEALRILKEELSKTTHITEKRRQDFLTVFEAGWDGCWNHMRQHVAKTLRGPKYEHTE